jgi:hypothetical protein
MQINIKCCLVNQASKARFHAIVGDTVLVKNDDGSMYFSEIIDILQNDMVLVNIDELDLSKTTTISIDKIQALSLNN